MFPVSRFSILSAITTDHGRKFRYYWGSTKALRAALSGKQAHTPRQRQQKKPAPPQRLNQLLIDIQQELVQGNGIGYAKWAKEFNLKQMAQTVASLQEYGLMDYAVLSEKAAAASKSYHVLSEEIKAAERRMAEIVVMEKQTDAR